LLEAKTADDFAHGLDDVDLVVAEGLEDDVELGLLFVGGSATTATATSGGSGSHGHHGRGGGDAELFLDRLVEVAELEDGHALNDFQGFFDLGSQFRTPSVK